MNAIIFYASTYNGNTLKIAESMAAVLSAELVSIDNHTTETELAAYDLIGFGSAIHFAEHDIRLQRFVSTLLLQGKKVFIFSTHGSPFTGSYHKALKRILKQQHAHLVDEFSCVGYDRTGPWVLINGCNKNRPNANDLFKARLFAERLRYKLNPLSSISQTAITEYKQGIAFRLRGKDRVAGDKIVFLNTTSCIQCGRCMKVCPMNIFQKSDVMLSIEEQDCIQCHLCTRTCPTNSIYIRESFANGIRLALQELFSTKLQNRYKSKNNL